MDNRRFPCGGVALVLPKGYKKPPRKSVAVFKLSDKAAQYGEGIIHIHSALTQTHAADGSVHDICPLRSGKPIIDRCNQPRAGWLGIAAKTGGECFFYTQSQSVRCQGEEKFRIPLA